MLLIYASIAVIYFAVSVKVQNIFVLFLCCNVCLNTTVKQNVWNHKV